MAEDFLHLLGLMQKRANELCVKCNILSLGTYLKTFNYYTYTGSKVPNYSKYFKCLLSPVCSCMQVSCFDIFGYFCHICGHETCGMSCIDASTNKIKEKIHYRKQ